MKTGKRTLALALALLLVLLAGCGEKAPETADGAEAEPFRVRLSHEVSLDPALANGAEEESVILALYEGLLRVRGNENGLATVVPGVAKKYEITENFDGTITYVFTLRSTARWSDGKRVKASDFVYAWKRLADPALAAPQSELLHAVAGYDEARETGDMSLLQVEAKGTDTLLVTLDEPCVGFIVDVCAAAATVPLRYDIVADGFRPGKDMVVNGPFRAQRRSANGTLSLERNEDYYESRLIKVDALELVVVEDGEAAYDKYIAGELDYIPAITKLQAQRQIQSEQEPPVQTKAGVGCVLYNHLTDEFSDARIRKAFDLAIDRGIFASNADVTTYPATGFVPFGIADDLETAEDFRTVGGTLSPTDRDTYGERCAEAKKLLTQSGHYGGAGLDGLEYIYVAGEEAAAQALALQSMWQKELGVTVTLFALSQEEYENRLLAGDFDLAGALLLTERNDAMRFLEFWNSESETNILGYVNTAYDLLLGVGERETDLVARTAFLHDAERMLLEDNALSPLYFAAEPYLIRESWQGLTRDAFGRSFFAGLAAAQE